MRCSVSIRAYLAALVSFLVCQRPLAAATLAEELLAVAKRLVSQLEQKSLRRVAITEFVTLSGESTGATKFLTDQLAINLVSEAKTFGIIDRANFDSLLHERNLYNDGLLDQNTVRKLGKFAGVDAVIVGTATPLSSSVNLSIKVLDVGTATILAALSTTVAAPDIGEVGVRSPSSANQTVGNGNGTQRPIPKSRVFANEFISIEVESIGVTNDFDALTLSLSFQNILASEPFSIAVQDAKGSWLKVIDNQGREWSSRGVGGSITDISEWVKIAPGQKTYVNARLVANGYARGMKDQRGVVLSLTGTLYKFGADEQAIVDKHPQKPHPRTVGSFSEVLAIQAEEKVAREAANGRRLTFGISNIVIGSTAPSWGLTLKRETTAAELAAVKSPYGFVVTAVQRGGVAQTVGVRVGDILEKLNGVPLRTWRDVDDTLTSNPTANDMQLLLNRGGVRLERAVRVNTLNAPTDDRAKR